MLLEAAQHHHSDDAWVRSVDETIAEGWWGPTLTDDARNRLGDVALVAHADVSFNDCGRQRAVQAHRPSRVADRPLRCLSPCWSEPPEESEHVEATIHPVRRSPAVSSSTTDGAVVPDEIIPEEAAIERREAVEEPAKVMRIGSMIKQLLEEVRTVALDEPARDRLKEIYDTSIKELGTAVSPDLRDELERVTIPFGGQHPTDAELRVAQAQLVGWLEGLFHGIQATLFAQQMAARSQMEMEIRGARSVRVAQASPGRPRATNARAPISRSPIPRASPPMQRTTGRAIGLSLSVVVLAA